LIASPTRGRLNKKKRIFS